MRTSNPQEFAVCLGMDALRLATGGKPQNFTPFQIVGLLTRAAERAQPLRLSREVLDCHAEFGGDLRDMQRKMDMDHPGVRQ